MFIDKASGDFSTLAEEIMRIFRQENINSVYSVSSVVKEKMMRLQQRQQRGVAIVVDVVSPRL